ncbi:haloacid dehalogenase-like hydrolase [Sphaerisporangium sp. TRM90804]|uniref:HAD family hydrolase n=1 Tax=Sphaerisporangium sp. TRM90804 TaxID=3031113 RepID=UPI0024489972|nr:haloacid dehalogenase-like hydrolase [Sphaerisporangium sp. TRM90804]MDH2427555.1 haloacid dehalogenase-like hydrolase [Sphaerisporangium sp. TRM90804]
MSARRIVLWDIDHTLVDTRGVGREFSAEAFKKTTGVPMRQQAKVDGITESVIFRETAKLHGLTTDRSDFERFAEALAETHRARSAELRERGYALPGAAVALDALAELPGVVQTVLTGNVRQVARIKMELFGLDRHVTWPIGAFGEDDDVRAELVRIALGRASFEFGEPATPANAILIGDTPADVEAGQEAGVTVIAVASGRSSVDDLRRAGADHVLPSLVDTASLIALVNNDGKRPSG